MYSIFLYDYFFVDGNDLFPGEKFSKSEAERKLFEDFSDSKLELIEEETYITVPKGRFASTKEVIKNNYWVVYPSDFVEGAFLKIEKKRK